MRRQAMFAVTNIPYMSSIVLTCKLRLFCLMRHWLLTSFVTLFVSFCNPMTANQCVQQGPRSALRPHHFPLSNHLITMPPKGKAATKPKATESKFLFWYSASKDLICLSLPVPVWSLCVCWYNHTWKGS